MISMDMKYTALYWALRFVEQQLDIHIKMYKGYDIVIDAEKQSVDYGKDIKVVSEDCHYLKRHKDFVILECIDRLLSKGYKPTDIIIDGRVNKPDIIVAGVEIFCEQWGKDYQKALSVFVPEANKKQIVYTSRLVSGLLEYKNELFVNGDIFEHGFFEKEIELFDLIPAKEKKVIIEQVKDISDYEIYEDELIAYNGKSKIVKVPNGIKTIGASAFWNNTFVEEVILPESLERLGGDCFYYCKNLKRLTIPKNVWIMGNNPFAGCPKLALKNDSKEFVLEDGVLYNKDKTNLIHYTIAKAEKEFIVPNSVVCLGKHCFYACDNLEKIVIPNSVIRFENNPFSGCTKLNVENHSPYYIFKDGVIYNKFMTTVIGCLNGTKKEEIRIPDGVTLISRNSFWNCKNIGKLVLPKAINRIGYNPFAGCENLLLEGNTPCFDIEKGIVFTTDKTHMCCATNRAIGVRYKVPDSVTRINRGVFSGCKDLKYIDLNNVTYIDKSSFTNCNSLEEVFIPDGVTYIGEWAFSYCTNLRKISIPKTTIIDRNAFNECPVKIEWRD